MFKSREELMAYIEEECYTCVKEPNRCYICGEPLVDAEGYTEYHYCEECPDEMFCSEYCIANWLISMGYLKEEEE